MGSLRRKTGGKVLLEGRKVRWAGWVISMGEKLHFHLVRGGTENELVWDQALMSLFCEATYC